MIIWLTIASCLFAGGFILLLALCFASGRADQVAEAEAHAVWRAAAHLRGLDRSRTPEPATADGATLALLAEGGRQRLRAEHVCVYACDTADHRRLVLVAGGGDASEGELLELADASLESGALLVTPPGGLAPAGRPLAVASAVPLMAEDRAVGALVATWPAPGRPFSPLDRAVVRHLSDRAADLIADRNGRLVGATEVLQSA